MKAVYPVIFTQLNDGYMAYSPDFEINTQGNSLTDAIAMMRDAIGLMGPLMDFALRCVISLASQGKEKAPCKP